MSFQEFHDFQHLVDTGLAEPILCGVCETRLVNRYDEKDGEPEPALWCYACDDYTTPGLNTIERVRRALNEIR